MKNQSFFITTMFVLLQLLLIAVFVPSSWVESVASLEYRWISDAYTEKTVTWMDDKVEGWHYGAIYGSGLADGLSTYFLRPADAGSTGMDRLGERLWFPFLESRGAVLSDLFEIILYRVISVSIWLPLILLVFIPSAIDGFIERKIKQHTFKYPSPILYRYGAKFTAIISGLLILSFISPIPTPPVAFPTAIIAVVATMGLIVVGNMPKRL